MPRTPLIAGNWKLNLTIAEGTALVKGLAGRLKPGVEVAVCPTFVALHAIAQAAAGTGIGIGGQDLCDKDKGAFTGEVSAGFLKDAGARYAIIGHSERRQLYGETDASVNAKLKAALAGGLTPIVCIGETLAERDGGQLQAVLKRQVDGAVAGIAPSALEPLVIAYEQLKSTGTRWPSPSSRCGRSAPAAPPPPRRPRRRMPSCAACCAVRSAAWPSASASNTAAR